MQQRKLPSLRVLQGERVRGMTCFSAHDKYDVDCRMQSCRYWIPGARHACVLIEAGDGEHTQHEIGQIFNLTRMRICQIEKQIYQTIRQAS